MNKKILLIDDDEDEHMIFRTVINEIDDNIKCLYADSIQEGFKVLQQFMPDLIFLDINMPAINGAKYTCGNLLNRC